LGCVYKPEIDGKVPLRPRLMTRDYTALPKKYSLKKYCPEPKSQGQFGTCTAWSTTYAGRTICEAVSNGWTNIDSITQEAFSPIFIYKQLNTLPNCEKGTSVAEALNLLKSKGAPKFHSFDVLCAEYIPNNLYSEAFNYKIDDYTTLFNTHSGYMFDYDKISSVKKALVEEHPVVMAMDVYESFDIYDGSDLWNGRKDTNLGGHAMCVIGYDDDKYGGAFEIMNSWGTSWASNGYVWMKYEDFRNNARYAYDVYLKKKDNPVPTPIPIQKKYTMSGDMWIVERDGGGKPLVINDNKGDIPYYYITEDYPSGKKFRLVVSNHEAAWVYVIASDMQNHVTKLFPYADNISAYLNYSDNNIAIPDETHEFELDATPGIDYFCVLYSQEELDVNYLVEEIRLANGSFYDKLKTVLGELLAPKEDIRYIMNDIGFSAKTDNPVVPLVVEISHQDIKVDYQQ
jgi:C1A family cysteine protease